MNDSYLTRETLLKRMKSMSDEEAWEEFIENYQGFIFAIINKMKIREPDIDDLYQKVMVKLWESLPNFDYAQRKGKFRNWLYTIVRNTVLTYITHNDMVARQSELLTIDHERHNYASELDEVIEKEWEKHVAALAFTNVSKKVTKEMMAAFQAHLENEPVEATSQRLNLSESSIYVYRMRVKNALVAEINNLREILE